MSNQEILESYKQEITNLINDIKNRPVFLEEFKKYQDELDFPVSKGEFMVEMEMIDF